MSIIACHECRKEMSDTARACPHCGAKFKKSGLGWFSKTLIVLASLIGLFILFAVSTSDDPAYRAMAQERMVIEECTKEMTDPMRSAASREAHRYFCERLRDDFVRKHGRQP